MGHNFAADLEKKMEVEIRIREAALQMLKQLPSEQTQTLLEAAKNVFVSDRRMKAFKSELERTRSSSKSCSKLSMSETMSEPSTAKLTISEIRFPLMWSAKDHFRNRGDPRKFSLFCCFELVDSSAVVETSLAYEIDRTCTDVTFTDFISFENVPHDFRLRMKLFSYQLESEHSHSPPSTLKTRFQGSISKTIAQKISHATQQGRKTMLAFDEIGWFEFRLQDFAQSNASCFNLKFNEKKNTDTCPPLDELFVINVQLQPTSACQPLMEETVEISLDSQESTASYVARLCAGTLCCTSTEHRDSFDLMLDQGTKIQVSGSKLELTGFHTGPCESILRICMHFHRSEDLSKWEWALKKQICDLNVWGYKFARNSRNETGFMDGFDRPQSIFKSRGRSLYDGICSPVITDLNTERKKSLRSLERKDYCVSPRNFSGRKKRISLDNLLV